VVSNWQRSLGSTPESDWLALKSAVCDPGKLLNLSEPQLGNRNNISAYLIEML
jgi:hypothetical protein